ncbi:MAG: DUF433 domain-containing protein [Myxococcales bacterium]
MQFDRITTDPSCMRGQPCIRNLGVPVRRVVEMVAEQPDRAVLKREYPQLEDDDIAQALCYAASMVDRAVCWLR